MDMLPSPPARLCLLASIFLLLAAPAASRAAGQPVAVKELCLMLHGGYTGDEVLRETSGRPLLDPIDAANEQLLRAAGADTRFIAALKSTHRTVSTDEAAALRPRPADAATSAPPPRPTDTSPTGGAYSNSIPADIMAKFGKVSAQLRHQLVLYRDGNWLPYDDSTLSNKQLFAIYFAAQSDAQCRQFTPRLIEFYRDFTAKHPPFELVFFSMDRSATEMEDDVRQNAMPWPVVAFDREAQQTNLMELGKQGIPRLMLIDGSGRLISDTFTSGKYTGPQHVLDDLTHLADAANKGSATANAALAPATAAAPAAAISASSSDAQAMDKLLRGKLVRFANGAFVPFDLDPLERKKVIALYFSSYVSAAGRQFAPELVKFYQRTAAAHPEFEVVTVSGDKSVFNMQRLVSLDQMPWPAVSYDQVSSVPMFKALAYLSGASRLAVFNGQGQFLADYSIALPNPNVATILDDLGKVVANPTQLSALAPPHASVPGAP